MNKPSRDQYRTKDFLCAIKTMAYINDLEKYIAYLEQKEAQLQQHGVIGKYQKTLLRDFFLWICRDAKVEVIDAETSIEIRGDWSDETPLVPVLTVDELVQRFFDTCATAKGGPAGD